MFQREDQFKRINEILDQQSPGKQKQIPENTENQLKQTFDDFFSSEEDEVVNEILDDADSASSDGSQDDIQIIQEHYEQ